MRKANVKSVELKDVQNVLRAREAITLIAQNACQARLLQSQTILSSFTTSLKLRNNIFANSIQEETWPTALSQTMETFAFNAPLALNKLTIHALRTSPIVEKESTEFALNATLDSP